MNIKSENYNIYFKIRLDEYGEEDTIKYSEFYKDIPNENLQKIFSLFHFHLNDLLKYLNRRLKNGHYTAYESRRLIYWIEEIDSIQTKLKISEYSFEIIPYYKEVLDKCGSFLQSAGGSPIPKDFEKIDIVELNSIFILKSSTSIERNKSKVVFTTKLIGEGSYANVYKYKDDYYNRHFVIKQAKKDLNDREYERFKREFNEMKKLNSPYVIEVYNFNDLKRQYTMEFADETLEKYISKNNNKLTVEDRINIVNQILRAFSYINRKGVLHRDISTKNVLIKRYDDIIVVKISDFGLVKLENSNLTKVDTEIKGSLNDPKLEITGFSNYSIEHETYALVRLIYYIMTGKMRLESFSSKKLELFVNKGISDDLNSRFKSADEIKCAFNNVVRSFRNI